MEGKVRWESEWWFQEENHFELTPDPVIRTVGFIPTPPGSDSAQFSLPDPTLVTFASIRVPERMNMTKAPGSNGTQWARWIEDNIKAEGTHCELNW